MTISRDILIALSALGKSKGRTFLTMLGIIIGVGAVIAMVAIGQGAKFSIEQQIAGMGTNTLFVFPGSTTQGGLRGGFGSRTSLTPQDAEAVRYNCPSVQWVAPLVRTTAQVVSADQNWSTAVMGTTEEFLSIRKWNLSLGRCFTNQEVDSAAKVCVLGKIVAENLFGSLDPVGNVIRIKKIPFKVIGVLEGKGKQDDDDVIIVPYTTAQKRLTGTTHINFMLISAVSKEAIPTAQEEVTRILRERHHISGSKEDDFDIRTQLDVIAMATQSSGIMTLLLAAIASVSLLVGGIGIMNIMLVSVTERYREIGIRMAVGARPRDILWQFLIEAMVLSLLGGMIGVLLGVTAAKVISLVAKWPTFVSMPSIVISFLFAGGVGVFFGLYPALKASRLDPIIALRHD